MPSGAETGGTEVKSSDLAEDKDCRVLVFALVSGVVSALVLVKDFSRYSPVSLVSFWTKTPDQGMRGGYGGYHTLGVHLGSCTDIVEDHYPQTKQEQKHQHGADGHSGDERFSWC